MLSNPSNKIVLPRGGLFSLVRVTASVSRCGSASCCTRQALLWRYINHRVSFDIRQTYLTVAGVERKEELVLI